MHRFYEIVWKPSQKQVKRVPVSRKSDRQTPDLPIAQEIAEHCDFAALRRPFRRGSPRMNIVELLSAQSPMFGRVAVNEYEGEKI